MDTFDSFWEMDSDKKLNRPRRWRRSDDNIFLVQLKFLNNYQSY
jgi:hypothetical protein